MGHVVRCGFLTAMTGAAAFAGAGRQTFRLTMITGADVAGRLLSFTDDAIVLEVEGFPCAIGFDQVETGSAYRTVVNLYAHRRGGSDRLTAADHYALGSFALRRDRYAHAKGQFAAAVRLDPSYRAKSDSALAAHRRYRHDSAPPLKARADDAAPPAIGLGIGDWGLDAVNPQSSIVNRQSSIRVRIIAGYKEVGERIRRHVGRDLILLETPRFLIWTDWAKAEHDALRSWCEQTYAVVSGRLGISPGVNVFAGKCPVFCMRSKKRFRTVARLLDDYDAAAALGYTSASGNGHVHVVVCRQGGSPAGRDAFAATLIHETTHAFLHRYRSGAHVPAWLNEGLANYVAEAVLGDRCPNAETAEAAARAVVDGNYRIEAVFSDDGALQARYYPVAQSLVSFLIERDDEAFSRLIDDIKLGTPPDEAMLRHYTLTTESLEAAWRDTHRNRIPE